MTNVTISNEIEQLAELIKDFSVAILTTICQDRSLCSRPMATLNQPFDGGMWFFTKADSTKAGEVEEEGQVNVTYENSQDSVYVSLSGRATLVQDRQQIEKLWDEDLRTWFPEGLKDPRLALLRVDVNKWAYKDGRCGEMSERSGQLRDMPEEVVPDFGDHRRVDLNGIWVSQDVGTRKTRNEIPI